MAVVHVDLDAQYQVKSNDQPVTLNVTFGEGQVGAYSVFVGMDPKGSNTPVELGIKENLIGKRTLVVATIRDTLTETNLTSMTVELSEEGAPSTTLGPFTKEVPKQKDTAIYTLTILNS